MCSTIALGREKLMLQILHSSAAAPLAAAGTGRAAVPISAAGGTDLSLEEETFDMRRRNDEKVDFDEL